MKKMILKSVSLLSVALLVNAALGLVRLRLGDEIPYKTNIREQYFTDNQYKGRCDTTVYVHTRTDLGHDSIHLPQGLLRIYDHYGFSNMTENKSPELLFIGDSFFEDPQLSTTEGIQALCNQKMNRNGSYNIGAHGCSGFKVYNELSEQYFSQKPRLIIFETVERALSTHIEEALLDLRKHRYKTLQHHYYGFDLLLGANFCNLKESKLFFTKEDKKYGTLRTVRGKEVYFLRNKCSIYANLKYIVNQMKEIKDILRHQNIQIVFVVAPDKESMYPELFGASSLAALQALMQQNGIAYLDVYSPMRQDPDAFYFRSDTHWNEKALDLLSSLAVDYYKGSLQAQ
jgi:hypothetical protein